MSVIGKTARRLAASHGQPRELRANPNYRIAMVCSCFAVGLDTLLKTIADHQLTTVAEVGDLLRAGTNCRSCIPEIRTMLRIAGKAA